MSTENRVHCILGNDECPPTCPIFEGSKAMSENMGDNFNPRLSRMAVVFADAFNPNVNVLDVAAMLAGCVNEKQPQQD